MYPNGESQMSLALSLVIIFATALLLTGASMAAQRKRVKLDLTRKIVAGVLAIVALVRYMLKEEAFKSMNTQGLNMWSPFGNDILSTVISALLIWFSFAAIFTVIMDAFIEARVLRHISVFFATPVLILDVCLFTTYITGVVGKAAYASDDIRIPLMAIEIGIALAMIASRITEDRKELLPSRSETVRLLWVLPLTLVAIIPSYLPWIIVGNALTPAGMELKDFTFEHRLVLYSAFILPYLIYRVLKDKPEKEDKTEKPENMNKM